MTADPQAEASRLAVYVLVGDDRRLVAEVDFEGLGLCLKTLQSEGEFAANRARVGVFDQDDRVWLVDPFKGQGFAHV